METTTQEFLEIQDIREGVMVLKNNNLRGVLMVSSMNFALKSEQEQTSAIYAFQNFLNSLDFTCQIVVQSRNINITPYLDTIRKLEENQTNELLKAQTVSYINFIGDLVKENAVTTKNFYVVVPYSVMEALGAGGAIKQINFLGFLGGSKKRGSGGKQLSDEDFEKCKSQLWQRMEFVAMGLKRCGLEIIPLTTPELIELFWAIHHPNEAEVGYSPRMLPELLK